MAYETEINIFGRWILLINDSASYLHWITCCKVAQLNIQFSQGHHHHIYFAGSAATDLRWGGRFYFSFFCSLSENVSVKESLGRPFTVVTGGLIKCSWCFFVFFSPRVLRVPSTDRPETLPPDRNLRVFDNASPKIWGGIPPKKWEAKNMQNFGRFLTTSDFDREYLRNGWRYPKSADVTNYGNSSCV